MTKTCPSCNVLAPPDARYCRHCGAQLQRIGGASSSSNVSPIAATVPLSNQNTTDEIVAPPAPPSTSTQTSEVTREELDNLFRASGLGGVRDANARRDSDGHSSQQQQGAASTTNYAEQHLDTNVAPEYASGDFDPEQTQITISVRPLTSRNLPADATAAAAATVATTRAAGDKPQFISAPQQVTLSPTGSLQTPSSQVTTAAAAAAAATPTRGVQSNESRALRVWLGMGLAIILIVGIGAVALAAFWFSSRGWGGASPDTPATVAVGEASAPASNDPKQLANTKLEEAGALIASGNTQEALARLREAAVLDPTNVEPHRRLARLLLANNSRREGIEELRVVTRLAPDDAEAWLTLASAQVAEGLYANAVESYRGLGEASPAAFARDTVQLAYADALRLSGRVGEARAIYRRLAMSSSDAEVARASQRQLAQPTPTPADETADEAEAEQAARAQQAARADTNRTPEAANMPSPSSPAARNEPSAPSAVDASTNSLSPSERYQRGIGLWATNRGAAVAEFRAAAERGNADASYYLGLSIAEGRDPRALRRADLVAALVHFGRARRSKFREQAVTYEEQLGRELDRRRNNER